MILIEWKPEEKRLIARTFCRKCNASNVITAYDNVHFWAEKKRIGEHSLACDKCRNQIKFRYTQKGAEIS